MAKLAKFSLGQLVSTPGCLEAFVVNGVSPMDYIARHASRDWGEGIDADDARENELSIIQGFRILSSYRLPDNTKIWIITEADRSATTCLLPEEY
jgi:hypothetical protein